MLWILQCTRNSWCHLALLCIETGRIFSGFYKHFVNIKSVLRWTQINALIKCSITCIMWFCNACHSCYQSDCSHMFLGTSWHHFSGRTWFIYSLHVIKNKFCHVDLFWTVHDVKWTWFPQWNSWHMYHVFCLLQAQTFPGKYIVLVPWHCLN
jgi:hypothetical protein